MKVWTDSEIETLTRMWREGESIQVIADALGRTRDSIIGKAHKIGIAPHCSPRGKKHSDETRSRAKRLRSQGYSFAAISDALNISAGVVYAWLEPEKHRETQRRYRENKRLEAA